MTSTNPRKLPRLFTALSMSVAAAILGSAMVASPASAAPAQQQQVRLGEFKPLFPATSAPKHLSGSACKLPSSRDIAKYGDYMRYTEFPALTTRKDVGQDTFFSYRPTRIGNDLNWYISPYLGGAYNARLQAVVKYVDLNGVCRTGTMLIQYGVRVTNVQGIDPTARLTRAVFTKRANWKYLVGAEISVLPLRTTASYAAEWQKAGNRAMLYPVGHRFVEHASPTFLPEEDGTTVMAVVWSHYKVRLQVRYTDVFGRTRTTKRTTYGACGRNKFLHLPVHHSAITATLMEGVPC